MINLDGKRALVCGGTSGIGEAAAEAIRDCGADVVILSRSASGKNTIACNLEDLDSLNNSVSKEIENNGKIGIFSKELYFFSILYTVDSI